MDYIRYLLMLIVFKSDLISSQCADSARIDILNDTTGTLITTLTGHDYAVNGLKVIQSDLLASGSDDNLIILWNLTTYTFIADLTWHTDCVNAIETFYASDGTTLLAASTGADLSIVIWNPFTRAFVKKISEAHDYDILCLINLGSNYLASCSDDNTIKIWETVTFTFVRRLVGHGESVYALEILSNGYIASGSLDTYVGIWDPSSGLLIDYFQPPFNAQVNSIKQLNSGLLAIVGKSKTMYFLDMSTRQFQNLTLPSTHDGPFVMALYNNNTILSTVYSYKVGIINATSKTLKTSYSSSYGSGDTVFCVEHAPLVPRTKFASMPALTTSQYVTAVIGGLDSGYIEFWDINNGKKLLSLCGHQGSVNTLKLINSYTLASGSDDKKIFIWDISIGTKLRALTGHSDAVSSLEFLTTGYLVSCSLDETIKIWNYTSGAVITTISNFDPWPFWHVKQINSYQFACSTAGNYIHIFDITTYVKVKTLSGHTTDVMYSTPLSNGLLASCSLDQTVRIWNVSTSTTVTQFSPFSNQIRRLKQLSDGSVVICGNSSSVFKWDLNVPQEVYFWDNIFSSGECFDMLVYNEIILLASNQAYVKLINSTSNEPYLGFSTARDDDTVYSLELVQNVIVPSYQINAPAGCPQAPSTTTTTTTTTTTRTTTSTTTKTTTTTTTSTTTSTTTITTTITTSTTIVATTFPTNSTSTSIIKNNGIYKIVKQSDMSYLANNIITSSYQLNRLRCGKFCSNDASCGAFVYYNTNKNCTLFKQLTTQLVNSPSSTVYFKN